MTDAIDNTEDVIDSRSVIERIAELMPFRIDRVNATGDGDTDLAEFKTREEAEQFIGEEDYDPEKVTVVLIDEELEELQQLEYLAHQGEDIEDWEYGVTLVRDSYFETYAEELADDIGAIDRNAGWPLTFINWEAAADALKQDYTSLLFDGVTYWAR